MLMQHYDDTFYPRVIVLITVVITWVIGLLAVCYTHLGTPLYVSLMYAL